MTDINNKKEDVKMHLKDLRSELKRMHLAVTEELLLPEPEDVKALMSKMDLLLNAIENNCCLLYTSPSPRDLVISRMPSSA